MVFTWSVESVILGLVSFVLINDYRTLSALIVSCLTLALHVLSSASNLNKQYVISISHLCVITGLLLSSLTIRLDAVAPIMNAALLGIMELAAVGMVFASTQTSSALIFHKRAHFALGVSVLLDNTGCWPDSLGLIVTMVYITTQLAPFDTIANTLGVLGAGTLAAFLFIGGKLPAFYVMVALGVLSLFWLMGIWLVYWVPSLPNMFVDIPIPGIPAFEGIQIGALRIPPGPWLETVLFIFFFGLTTGVGVWQFTLGYPTFLYVVIAPLVLSVVWIVLVWVYRPVESTEPSAPTLQQISRPLLWPRIV